MAPEGWRVTSIKSLLESCSYGLNGRLATTPDSGPPVLRMGNIQAGRLALGDLKYASAQVDMTRYGLRRGDVLLNRTNSAEQVGKVAFVDNGDGLSFASYLVRLRVKDSSAAAEWLFQKLNSPEMQARLRSLATKGVSQSNINPTKMQALEVPVPPLAEQRKIAAILGSVDALIERTQAVIDQVEVVKKGLMQELLTRGPPGRHNRFKQTEIGEIPESWDVVPLDELVAKPICYGVLKPGPDTPGGVPVVRVQDYPEDKLILSQVQRSAPEIVEPYGRSTLAEGDILISIRGTAGRVCLVPGELEGGNISRDSARISLTRPELLNFVAYVLRGPASQEFVMGAMRGLAVRGINIGDLRKLPVPQPPPAEREEMTSILLTVDERLWSEKSSLSSLVRLKAGLSAVLLSGEVRVQTDESEAAA